MDYVEEASRPLVSDEDRVEIIMLVIENDRDVARECAMAILTHVKYPFKLSIYENSLNSTNTSKVWNKLIRESNCGYICLIDSDASPRNDFISLMMDVLKRHPEAAAVGPAGDLTSVVNEFSRGKYNPNRDEIPMSDNLSGFCFLFRKSIMEEYGYFDERFVFYGQDSEWTYRMSLVPKPFYVVPKAYVNHGNSVSSYRVEATNKDFSRHADVAYARKLLAEISGSDSSEVLAQALMRSPRKPVNKPDYKNYNPWKFKGPIPHHQL